MYISVSLSLSPPLSLPLSLSLVFPCHVRHLWYPDQRRRSSPCHSHLFPLYVSSCCSWTMYPLSNDDMIDLTCAPPRATARIAGLRACVAWLCPSKFCFGYNPKLWGRFCRDCSLGWFGWCLGGTWLAERSVACQLLKLSKNGLRGDDSKPRSQCCFQTILLQTKVQTGLEDNVVKKMLLHIMLPSDALNGKWSP